MAIDTAAYKTRLTEMFGELTEELKTIGIHNPENPSDWIATPEGTGENLPDLNDAADRAEEWGERRALIATLETRYNNITLAHKKIEERTYGVCEMNGEEIEADRLDANPAARTCKAHIDEEANLPK